MSGFAPKISRLRRALLARTPSLSWCHTKELQRFSTILFSTYGRLNAIPAEGYSGLYKDAVAAEKAEKMKIPISKPILEGGSDRESRSK